MLAKLVSAMVAVLLCAGIVRAEEIRAKVKGIESTITVTIGDKDQILTLAKDAKIIQLVGKKAKKAQPQDVAGGLTSLPAGSAVTITTETRDGKDVVTQVKVEGLVMKKKKNK